MKSDSVALTQRIIMKLSRKPNPMNGRPLTTDTEIDMWICKDQIRKGARESCQGLHKSHPK